VRRLPERARYDRESVYAILDEGFVCHLGTCAGGEPRVLPTAYARVGDALYLHGAVGNVALAAAVQSEMVCVAVTLVDGLVLARSAFHHSINYRSVVVFGPAAEVIGQDEKNRALLAFVEHVVPGRTAATRPPNASEIRATRVIRVEIAEASAKVRAGGPKDDPEDLELDGIWAGELPFSWVPGAPVPDAALPGGMAVPGHIAGYRRPAGGRGRDN